MMWRSSWECRSVRFPVLSPGKGRIGSETRRKVMEFIEEHDYHPNSSAKSLAQAKTENIALLIPEVKTLVAQPFFYMCMCGVNEVAQARGYDMFVVTTNGQDTARLKRLLDNDKVGRCDPGKYTPG